MEETPFWGGVGGEKQVGVVLRILHIYNTPKKRKTSENLFQSWTAVCMY